MEKYLVLLCLLLLSSCAKIVGPDPERFQINGDGTVLDMETNLMWAESDNSKSLTWEDSVDFYNSYEKAGYENWRSPTSSELAALLEEGVRKNGEIIRISADRIWASETDDDRGAFCNFNQGVCGWLEKAISISLHALPVRDTVMTPSPSSPATDLPTAKPQSIEQRLQVVEMLHKQKLISQEEYQEKRAAILNEL